MAQNTSSEAKFLQIFAVGGGGFTHLDDGWPEDSSLEDTLVATAGPASKTKIGYFGHANNDDADKIRAFHKRFQNCSKTLHLPITADANLAKLFLSSIDILYVGGGSTLKMLLHWQLTGIDKALINAAHNGLVLAGVSAGAICWFDELLLTAQGNKFGIFRGLGLLPGSACPHYHNEPRRKNSFDKHILKDKLAPGIAIDDGVAVHVIDGRVHNIIKARNDGEKAYFVKKENGRLSSKLLKKGQKLG
ncbi:Type 1 glutamine amidotransferase-like domain-containing protein [Candidatus Puniceispirillum sp.]|nr:Type 1 glutamine amidotransferase-like domain-containing protein [Candidatus Puniceispirillum sp.]